MKKSAEAPDPLDYCSGLAASKALGITRWQVLALAASGKVRTLEQPGGRRMFHREDVKRLAEEAKSARPAALAR